MPSGEVVQNGYLMAKADEMFCHVATDVAGAAAKQNIHASHHSKIGTQQSKGKFFSSHGR